MVPFFHTFASLGTACSFTTEPHIPITHDFVFEPITCGHFHVDFELRARYDGLLALADAPKDDSLFAQIGKDWRRERQTDRDTERQTERQPDEETDRQTDGETDRQTER